MNLNCLTCQLSRKNSDNDMNERLNSSCAKPHFGLCLGGRVERSLSGNLLSRGAYEKSRGCGGGGLMVAAKKVKKASHHRVHNSGPVEFQPNTPRLVRSGGLRRDWSFEDLRQSQRMGKYISL